MGGHICRPFPLLLSTLGSLIDRSQHIATPVHTLKHQHRPPAVQITRKGIFTGSSRSCGADRVNKPTEFSSFHFKVHRILKYWNVLFIENWHLPFSKGRVRKSFARRLIKNLLLPFQQLNNYLHLPHRQRNLEK